MISLFDELSRFGPTEEGEGGERLTWVGFCALVGLCSSDYLGPSQASRASIRMSHDTTSVLVSLEVSFPLLKRRKEGRRESRRSFPSFCPPPPPLSLSLSFVLIATTSEGTLRLTLFFSPPLLCFVLLVARFTGSFPSRHHLNFPSPFHPSSLAHCRSRPNHHPRDRRSHRWRVDGRVWSPSFDVGIQREGEYEGEGEGQREGEEESKRGSLARCWEVQVGFVGWWEGGG